MTKYARIAALFAIILVLFTGASLSGCSDSDHRYAAPATLSGGGDTPPEQPTPQPEPEPNRPNIFPIAAFTLDQNGSRISVDASESHDPDGSLDKITWTWDDGKTASGSFILTHTFTSNGVYDVVLTLEDDRGGVGTVSKRVTVNSINLPPIGDDLTPPTKNWLPDSVIHSAYYAIQQEYLQGVHQIESAWAHGIGAINNGTHNPVTVNVSDNVVVQNSNKVILAIIDEPFMAHETLPDGIYVGQRWDFYNGDNNPFASQAEIVANADARHGGGSHGMLTLGTLAAQKYITGTAPGVTVMPIQIFGTTGRSSWQGIADAIVFATLNGADVISMSVAGYGDQPVLRAAINFAHNCGVILVAAAGNEGEDMSDTTPVSQRIYPAAYPNVISVGALEKVNDQIQLAWFTNTGTTIDCWAQGWRVLSASSFFWNLSQQLEIGSFYAYSGGTSLSCPQVAGLVCIAKGLNPSLTQEQIRTYLKGDMTWPSWEPLNAERFINLVVADAPTDVQTLINRLKARREMARAYAEQQIALGTVPNIHDLTVGSQAMSARAVAAMYEMGQEARSPRVPYR